MEPHDPYDGAIREGDPPYVAKLRRPTPSTAITMIPVGLSLFFFLAWTAQMAFVVPAYEREFADAKIRLPFITEMCVANSRWILKYYVVIPLVVVPAFLAAGVVSYLLRHSINNQLWSALWYLFMIGLPLVVNVMSWVALWLPGKT